MAHLDQNWLRRLDDYRAWCDEHGKTPSMKAADDNERSLGGWANRLRREHRRGQLAEAKATALKAIPGWTWGHAAPPSDPWPVRFEKILAWREVHGRWPSKRSDDDTERGHGNWIGNQRKAFWAGRLPDDQIAALEATPGWTWRAQEQWSDRYADLVSWVDEHGRLPREAEPGTVERSLHGWVQRQRTAEAVGGYDPAKRTLLGTVPGWKWIEPAATWSGRLAIVISVVGTSGRLPSTKSKDAEVRSAGRWAQRQRRAYRKGQLSDGQIAALEAVAGWHW